MSSPDWWPFSGDSWWCFPKDTPDSTTLPQSAESRGNLMRSVPDESSVDLPLEGRAPILSEKIYIANQEIQNLRRVDVRSTLEKSPLTKAEIEKVVSESCTDAGYEKFQKEAPKILKNGISAWQESEPLFGKLRLGTSGPTIEVDANVASKQIKELIKLHGGSVAKPAAVGAGSALVLGGAAIAVAAELEHKSLHGIMLDETGDPTAPNTPPKT